MCDTDFEETRVELNKLYEDTELGTFGMKSLIARSMKQATRKFFDTYADHIETMVRDGYRDGIRHNPRLIMYKMLHLGIEKQDVKKIQGVVNVLRYQGRIENHWTIDTTRSISSWQTYQSKEEALKRLAETFRLNPWTTQPRQIMLMCEASGYLGVMEKIARKFLCPYVPAKGDMSVQLKMEIAEYCYAPTTILYYGDFDKKGMEIPATIEADIRAINPNADLNFIRMFDDGRMAGKQMEELPTTIAVSESITLIESLVDTNAWKDTLVSEQKIIKELVDI